MASSNKVAHEHAEITAIIFKVAREIKPLAKLADNKYAKYKYVSIDEYYAEVASVAKKHGLLWRIYDYNMSSPNDETVVITYVVDLYIETGAVWEKYDCINVIHKVQGAQTCGSARSYAEKILMRTLFKVVTGEPDADYFSEDAMNLTDADQTDPDEKLSLEVDPPMAGGATRKEVPAKPKATEPAEEIALADELDLVEDNAEAPPLPEAAPEGPGEALEPDPVSEAPTDPNPAPSPPDAASEGITELAEDAMKQIIHKITADEYPLFKKEAAQDGKLQHLVAETFVQFVPTCKSYETLRGFWTENIAVIETLPADKMDQVRAAFNARRDTLADEMGIEANKK